MDAFPRAIQYVLNNIFDKYSTNNNAVWASKTVFIDRANSKNARAAFDGAAKQIRDERQSVYIFPEGTRSYYQHADLLPFKKGAFHLAVQAQVPVVPIVVANYSHVLTMKGGWKKWKFNAGSIKVKVLRPIKTEGLEPDSVEEMSRWCRDDMLRVIKELEEDDGKKGN
jgi:lysophosphatidate acyltransferase